MNKANNDRHTHSFSHYDGLKGSCERLCDECGKRQCEGYFDKIITRQSVGKNNGFRYQTVSPARCQGAVHTDGAWYCKRHTNPTLEARKAEQKAEIRRKQAASC